MVYYIIPSFLRLFFTVISIKYNISDPTGSIVVIWVHIFQTELIAEIYSKSLVRAIGKAQEI